MNTSEKAKLRFQRNVLAEMRRMATYEMDCNDDVLSGFMFGVRWMAEYMAGPSFSCVMYDFGNDPCKEQCENCKIKT